MSLSASPAPTLSASETPSLGRVDLLEPELNTAGGQHPSLDLVHGSAVEIGHYGAALGAAGFPQEPLQSRQGERGVLAPLRICPTNK